jgi:hypothetical protein
MLFDYNKSMTAKTCTSTYAITASNKHHMQVLHKVKYLGKPKYVQLLLVNQCMIEKALVDHYDLFRDHV